MLLRFYSFSRFKSRRIFEDRRLLEERIRDGRHYRPPVLAISLGRDGLKPVGAIPQ